jgi:hypothetical protein
MTATAPTPTAPARRRSWAQLALVALPAVATVVAVDRYLAARCEGAIQSQVDDGVRLLEATDPVALVLGSSQARSFEAVDELLAARTGGATRVASVAVEDGRLSTAAWVLEHRLAPLIEATGADGKRVRGRIRHLILVTDWWDSMVAPEGRATAERFEPLNLPARAWTWRDFGADLLAEGLTDFNRAYLGGAWEVLFGDSILVRDRGYGLVLRQLKNGRLEMGADELRQKAAGIHRFMELQAEKVCAPQEIEALEQILRRGRELGLEVTVVLYPLLADTLTPLARETTIARFEAAARPLAERYGARFFDWTYRAPLEPEHFRDLAHLNAAGHRRLAEWAVDGDLAPLFDGAGR